MVSLKEISQHLGFVGFVGSAIVLVGSTVFYNHSKIASLSTLSGTLSVLAWTGVERSQKRDRLKKELEDKSDTLLRLEHELRDVNYQRSKLLEQLKPYMTHDGIPVDIHALNFNQEALRTDLSRMTQRLTDVSDQLAIVTGERESLKLEADRLNHQLVSFEGQKFHWVQKFDQIINDHANEVEALTAKVNELNLENIQFKAQFENVDEVAKLRAESELRHIQDKLKELNDQYATTATLYNSAVADLKKLNADYVGEFTELNEAVSKGIPTAFQSVLDARDQELMRLSGHLNVLMQPRKFEGKGEYTRADQLIDLLHRSEHQLTLDAMEIQPDDEKGRFKAFYWLRGNAGGTLTAKALNDLSEGLAEQLFCVEPIKFDCDLQNPHRIAATFVHRKIKKDSKATIEKLWIPAAQFAKVEKLLKKPMTRVMGSTGEGKGIFVNLVLAIEANKPVPAVVRLHDPMDGSAQDYWQIAKSSKSKSATTKAVKSFVSEFDDRLENQTSEPATLDVFDEINIVADSDSSVNKALLKCSKGMRHNGMRAVMMGQSPSVGKKGLEWADLDNFNCAYFGTSIYTAIDKTPALQSKKESLRKDYEKLSDFCQRQNEELGLEGWNEYRVGLLVTQGKAYFFELPSADSIVCDWSKLEPKVATTASRVLDSKTELKCEHLNSSIQKTHRDDAGNPVRRNRKCKDCGARFTEYLSP